MLNDILEMNQAGKAAFRIPVGDTAKSLLAAPEDAPFLAAPLDWYRAAGAEGAARVRPGSAVTPSPAERCSDVAAETAAVPAGKATVPAVEAAVLVTPAVTAVGMAGRR
jgi:hypothetical protein